MCFIKHILKHLQTTKHILSKTLVKGRLFFVGTSVKYNQIQTFILHRNNAESLHKVVLKSLSKL